MRVLRFSVLVLRQRRVAVTEQVNSGDLRRHSRPPPGGAGRGGARCRKKQDAQHRRLLTATHRRRPRHDAEMPKTGVASPAPRLGHTGLRSWLPRHTSHRAIQEGVPLPGYLKHYTTSHGTCNRHTERTSVALLVGYREDVKRSPVDAPASSVPVARGSSRDPVGPSASSRSSSAARAAEPIRHPPWAAVTLLTIKSVTASSQVRRGP